MRTSPDGIKLIESFESLRLKAYPDPKTGGEPWTIGYGHAHNVSPGDTVTPAEAEELLQGDLMHAEDVVNKFVLSAVTDNEFSALVSFVFNCGEGNFAKSTLLKLVNAYEFDRAADEFLKWVSPGTSVTAGLTRRRYAERTLFLKG